MTQQMHIVKPRHVQAHERHQASLRRRFLRNEQGERSAQEAHQARVLASLEFSEFLNDMVWGTRAEPTNPAVEAAMTGDPLAGGGQMPTASKPAGSLADAIIDIIANHGDGDVAAGRARSNADAKRHEPYRWQDAEAKPKEKAIKTKDLKNISFAGLKAELDDGEDFAEQLRQSVARLLAQGRRRKTAAAKGRGFKLDW